MTQDTFAAQARIKQLIYEIADILAMPRDNIIEGEMKAISGLIQAALRQVEAALVDRVEKEVIDTKVISVADGSGDIENGEIIGGNFEPLRILQRQRLDALRKERETK